jgi:hypothetical protein
MVEMQKQHGYKFGNFYNKYELNNTLLYFYKWTFSIIYQVIPYTENKPVLYTST